MEINENHTEERVQDKPKIVAFCMGCSKAVAVELAEGVKADIEEMKCSVYAFVPHLYRTHNECPFNQRRKLFKKEKIRVGQGKTKSGGNR